MHRLASLTSTGLGTVAYGYDDYGKLTTITRGSTTYSLTYDAWNRPISTKVGTTALSTNTYDSDFRLSTVTYANGGALGACLETISYGYDAAHQDWADQLTSYNGEAVRYDDSGNPISYRGYTMAWQGKRLTSATKTGTAVSYSYDENGIRTQKTVNGTTTNYYYNGSVLISQVSGNDTLLFSYDANGSVVSVNFNGTDYYYVRNGQGDVIKLIDGNGTTVTEYAYDTWGKLVSYTGSLSATLGTLNPFRYRGYVYDTETGFYYLQSRYYDSEVGRFISADVLLSTGQGVLGHNMFAYCLNNPVNMCDPSGRVSKKDRLLTESDKLYGGKTTSSIRDDLRKARDLSIFIADPGTYNCYGNAIGKQIVAKPTGYTVGDSTRKTFEAVCADLGYENVRELESINDPIGEDEYKVAMKCGPKDFHFIRLIGNNWFNKSGTSVGLFVDQSEVESEIWYAKYMAYGRPRIDPTLYYDDETIYFAVKKGWDN